MKKANWLRRLWQRIRFASGGGFLCDTCKYDWGNVCRRRERPNTTQCPDYKKKQ